MNTSGMHSPAADGMTLKLYGQGEEDVVLVHGAAGDCRQWQPIARELAGSYRVVAVSRRFHWPDAPPQEGDAYTFEGQSEDLAALLRSLGRPAHLVGHSYGAGVALLTALRHHEHLRSLVLIEPPFGSLVPADAQNFADELASRDAMVDAVRTHAQAGDHERATETLIDWVQGEEGSFRRLPQSVQEGLRANALTVGPTYAAASPRVTCEQLRALALAALIVRGESTRPWYQRVADAATACLPQAEAAVVPGASHMCIVESPHAVARLLADFFARH